MNNQKRKTTKNKIERNDWTFFLFYFILKHQHIAKDGLTIRNFKQRAGKKLKSEVQMIDDLFYVFFFLHFSL